MNRQKVPADKALTHDIKTRVTKAHFERLNRQLASSHYRTMAEMLRDIICERELKVVVVDYTLSEVMERLIPVKKELNAMGNNINQIARALHGGGNRALHLVELLGLLKQVDGQLRALHGTIEQLAAKWLSEPGGSGRR